MSTDSENTKAQAEESPLSKRETEVLQEVAKGLSNQEIAQNLVISPNTVRVHLRNIFGKLEAQSRMEAAMRAIHAGWIESSLTTASSAEAEEEDEDDGPAETSITPAALPTARLAMWQKVYLLLAVAIALLVVTAPLARPLFAQFYAPTDNPYDLLLKPGEEISQEWQEVADLPEGRAQFGVAAYQDQLYVIGGTTEDGVTPSVAIFDPAQNIWSFGADKPTPVDNVHAVLLNDELYVPGGCLGDRSTVTDVLEVYQPESDTWRTAARLPEPLCAYAAAAYEDELYVIAGFNEQGYSNNVYIYNPAEDAWRSGATPYPLNTIFAAATATDEGIYVAGGTNGQNQHHDAVFRLDPASETWEAQPPMVSPRSAFGLVVVNDDLYAVGGGWESDEDLPSGTIGNEIFSNEQARWNDFEAPFVGYWRSPGVVQVNNHIYALGGQRGDDYLDGVYVHRVVFKVFLPFNTQPTSLDDMMLRSSP